MNETKITTEEYKELLHKAYTLEMIVKAYLSGFQLNYKRDEVYHNDTLFEEVLKFFYKDEIEATNKALEAQIVKEEE